MKRPQRNIALLPLDNRPVSYLLPRQFADFSGIDLLMPSRENLGGLKQGVDLDKIDKWLEGAVEHADVLIISLDCFVYGGLVQSRKHELSLSDLNKRVEKLKSLVKNKPIKIYAFSSVMRIPHYNGSDEEKDYFKEFGEKIHRWSELTYRVGRNIILGNETHDELLDKWHESSKSLPIEVMADFKAHREKNFSINLQWLEFKLFESLIFSCDDSSKYGVNLVEQEYIEKEINRLELKNIDVISGTDEIPLVLLSKCILKDPLKVSVFYSNDIGKEKIACYESKKISESIERYFNLLDLDLVKSSESDVELCVHLAEGKQGDHIFNNVKARSNPKRLIEYLEGIDKPFLLLDLAYANGSDPKLIVELLHSNVDMKNCFGYAGWNTCSNSAGSVISMGICRWFAEKNKSFDSGEFNKSLLIRFLDDYAYQSTVRDPSIEENELNTKMKQSFETFSRFLNLENLDVQYTLPWERSFEIEISV